MAATSTNAQIREPPSPLILQGPICSTYALWYKAIGDPMLPKTHCVEGVEHRLGVPRDHAMMRRRAGACLVLLVLGACAGDIGGASGGAADAGVVGADARPGPDAARADAMACLAPVLADPHAAERAACAFKAGARAVDTTTIGELGDLPIRHIVVVMKENRSFDHIFGGLAKLQPEAEVFPAGFKNKDLAGNAVAPFHLDTTCVADDPGHGWDAMHAQVDGGKMDGFVESAATSTGTDGHFAMGYYEQADLPFYYFLASTFSIADHYFASVQSATFPNRDYLLLGTSDKVTNTTYDLWPDPSLPTIFDRLDDAGVSWGVYADDHPLEESLNDPAHFWEDLHPFKPVQALIDAFAADQVPSVVFVDAFINVEDEHPNADVQVGEAWTKRIYDAAVASKAWPGTVLLFTYDEAGGFFDHMPPPDACLARPVDSAFFELGTRVPLIAVSPWARRHHVSHSPKEHTSITRFIEAVFRLPALTARDANSDALLDMFDFDCAPAAVPAAPAAGTGGCGGGTLTLDKTSYSPGDPIVVTFAGGPGNARDWIGVYPKGVGPRPGSTIWGYVGGGGHTATTGVRQGTIELGAGSENDAGDWPLAKGSFAVYYLENDGYAAIATAFFDVR